MSASDSVHQIVEELHKMGLSDENAEKARLIFRHAIDEEVAYQAECLTAKIDEYLCEHVKRQYDNLAESTSELAQLVMDLTQAGTAEARRAVILRISALSKAMACSAAKDSDWGGEAPDDAEANRRSITPHNEDYASYVQKKDALHVFNQVTEALTEDQKEEFKSLVEDVEFNGDIQVSTSTYPT